MYMYLIMVYVSNIILYYSNKCSRPHTLLSCYPVSLKDNFTISVDGAGIEKGVEPTNLQRAESNRQDITSIPPDTEIRVNITLVPRYCTCSNLISHYRGTP